jgi:hypothetical protein
LWIDLWQLLKKVKKSVGRAPVNEQIVEDLLQRMEQSSKKSLRN